VPVVFAWHVPEETGLVDGAAPDLELGQHVLYHVERGVQDCFIERRDIKVRIFLFKAECSKELPPCWLISETTNVVPSAALVLVTEEAPDKKKQSVVVRGRGP
jgi:hypothetical protein